MSIDAKKYESEEAIRIRQKYPDRIPVIIIPGKNVVLTDNKLKYLLPCTSNISMLMVAVRKKVICKPEEALFFIVKNRMLSPNTTLHEIDYKYCDTKSFLYVHVSKENTFG